MRVNAIDLVKPVDFGPPPPPSILEILGVTAELFVAACMGIALFGMPTLLVLWAIGD